MNNDPKKDIILNSGVDIIKQLGPRFFTVEYLAQKLRMSKKTIYKYFPNKDKIIFAIFDHVMSHIEGKFRTVVESKDNGLIKMMHIQKVLKTLDGQISIEKIAEVKERYPDLWNKIEQFRLDRKSDFQVIIQEGQDQGYFLKEKNADELSTMIVVFMNQTFQPDVIMKYNLAFYELFQLFFRLIIKGLVTEKGRLELERTGFE